MKRIKKSELLKEWVKLVHILVSAEKRKHYLKPRKCEKCNRKKRIHAHHYSYLFNDILKVRWLCGEHHRKWHAKYRAFYPSDEEILIAQEIIKRIQDESWDKCVKEMDAEEAIEVAKIKGGIKNGFSDKKLTKFVGIGIDKLKRLKIEYGL